MKLHCASRSSPFIAAVSLIGAFLLCFSTGVQAQSAVFSEVRTIAAATQGVPVERNFTVTTAGTYKVTLTDLGKAASPSAPLASLGLAITSGTTIVGTALTGQGEMQFTATAGTTYIVHVVGKPGPDAGQPPNVVKSGPFGVQITYTVDSSLLFGFSDTLALPPASVPNVGVLNDTFTVQSTGNYTITLTDLAFPQNLNTLQLALAAEGGTGSLAMLPANGTWSAPVPLQAGTNYNVVAFGQANATANAGLYAVVVRDSSNVVVYSRTLPLGGLTALGGATLTAGTYTLIFSDLAFPAALSTAAPLGAIATLDDQVGASLTASGSKTFTAVSGQYKVFALATAGALTPGSYNVVLEPASGTPVFSVAQAVTVPGGAVQGYTFSGSVTTAGSYNVQLADYGIPQALTSVSLLAVGNGVALANPLSATGNVAVAAPAGTLSLLVFAQAPTNGSVFGVFATPTGGGSAVVEATQGVGALYASKKVSLTSGGYTATVADVGFPAPFATLNALVTQGPTLIGSINAGGSLPPFAVSAAGDYFITFAAQPSTSNNPNVAGTYGISVNTVPAPTLNFISSATQVSPGGSATLTWSSQNATSCTASGAWSGPQATSGNTTTSALNASATYTLSCTGVSGSTQQSVTITVSQPSHSGGGGGALDPVLVAVLVGGLLLQRRRQRSTQM
jgi:hypothetical protein